ncbi:hypothetical protein K474DRAFT_1636833 [Panus rudis PR-1116 ss-1]|nr:hypothetical protein K474DRAFT_1636833 [Panus rudis PR-1116 ss-1]
MSLPADNGPNTASSTPLLGTVLPRDNEPRLGESSGEEDIEDQEMEEVEQDMVEDDDEEEDLDMDIREELEDVLSSGLESTGSFSFKKAYPEAPNPALNVAPLGTVGLPLSTREAEALKTVAQQAPFGKGTRTVVDTSVRDTWEIDGSQVSFKNPQWATFMTEVVKHVCQALGVNIAASAPRCEIYKLLLYQTGSHFLPHVDTEKTNGMFATVIVVLPSEFTGGEAHLTHSGLSAVYDSSQNSGWQTTVMAWYTDVMHEIKPITSGYRLAISYNLVHTTNSLRPALSNNTATIQHLRQILVAWQKDGGYNSPQKIVYLLDHKYSQANLRGSALKGSDAQLVGILDVLAKELGFHLGLANAICHLVGMPDETAYSYGSRRRRGYGWGYGYDDADGSFDGGFEEVTNRDLEIKEFVDLDGNLISNSLILDSEQEAIPSDLTEAVEEGDYESQEFEGYMGNYAGDLQRWYRRTVLVIWPDWANFDLRYSGANFVKACQTLDRLSTVDHVPSPRDVSLAHMVLSRLNTAPKIVTPAIMRIASAWGDYGLWTNAVAKAMTAGHCEHVQLKDFFLGIRKFGFNSIKPSLDLLLRHLRSNKARHEFLDILRTWTLQQNLANAETVVLPWIAAQYQDLLKCLLKPQRGEEELLISLPLMYGGIDTLRNIVFPQLISEGAPEFLRELAVRVRSIPTLPEEIKAQLAWEALKAAINKCSFDRRKDSTRLEVPPAGVRPDVVARSNVYVQTCLDTGMYDLVDEIIDKVLSTIVPPYTTQIHFQARDEALALLYIIRKHIIKLRLSVVPPITKMGKLLHACISTYVDRFQNGALPEISKLEVDALLQVVQLPGGDQEFATRLLPSILVISPTITSDVLRIVAEGLHAARNAPLLPVGWNGPGIPAAVTAVAKQFATLAPLSSSSTILRALEFCIKVDAIEACSLLMTRAIDVNKLRANYVETILVPLLPDLRGFAEKHGKLDLFAPVFQAVLLAWMDRVLGPPPTMDFSAAKNVLKRWSCTCTHCVSARAFILESPERNRSFQRIGAPSRKHLEGYLSSYAPSFATHEMIRSTPQGLTIKKTKPWFDHTQWKLTRERGCAILRSITPDEQLLKHILGPHYDRITRVIRGAAVVPTHSAPAQHAQPQAPSQTNAGPQTSIIENPANIAQNRSHPVPQQPSIANQSSVAGPSVQRTNTIPADGAPPAKRRKTAFDPNAEVIDLT